MTAAIETTCNACRGSGGWGSGKDAEHCMQCDSTGKVALQIPPALAVIDKPRAANFAQARQFLDGVSFDSDFQLAQCAAHLKDALDFADRVQGQKAVGYVSAEVLAALKDARIDGVGVSIYRQPFGDRVPVFTEPVASLGLLAAVSGFATKYLTPEREVPALCASDEHHKDVCDLFAAIEWEGRAK
jgi:hypothetical protein